jgi:hypothetical protein
MELQEQQPYRSRLISNRGPVLQPDAKDEDESAA